MKSVGIGLERKIDFGPKKVMGYSLGLKKIALILILRKKFWSWSLKKVLLTSLLQI